MGEGRYQRKKRAQRKGRKERTAAKREKRQGMSRILPHTRIHLPDSLPLRHVPRLVLRLLFLPPSLPPAPSDGLPHHVHQRGASPSPALQTEGPTLYEREKERHGWEGRVSSRWAPGVAVSEQRGVGGECDARGAPVQT